jgi:hypothetical protein
MIINILAILAQNAPPKEGHENLPLGFGIIGLILFLAMLMAYLWGKRGAAPKVEQHCPKCNAVRRGEFCSVCGAKF